MISVELIGGPRGREMIQVQEGMRTLRVIVPPDPTKIWSMPDFHDLEDLPVFTYELAPLAGKVWGVPEAWKVKVYDQKVVLPIEQTFEIPDLVSHTKGQMLESALADGVISRTITLSQETDQTTHTLTLRLDALMRGV